MVEAGYRQAIGGLEAVNWKAFSVFRFCFADFLGLSIHAEDRPLLFVAFVEQSAQEVYRNTKMLQARLA